MSSTAEPPVYDEHDIGAIEFWSRTARERDEVFADLRTNHPLSRHNPPVDLLGMPEIERKPYWALVRYEDVRKASRSPETFCSGEGVSFGDVPDELREATLSIIGMDAPRHTKLRGIISSAFTPRQIARIEEGIRRDAHTVVSEAAPTGGGNFVSLIAKRLPLMTISDMIGVPEADRERIVEASDVIVTAGDPDVAQGRPLMEVLGMAVFTLHQFAAELAAHREDNPSDDLMSALVHTEVDGERLTRDEIAAFFVLLSVAGNDTTRHTTSHAMRALTENPDQAAWLREDLGERIGTSVEEFIRWATPVMTFRRTTTREVELHGRTIPAGDKVILFYPSGNRDETAFEDPWKFDLTREPNHHLGFGGGGPHFCLGASLARTQLRAIFTEIYTQIPDIEVGELVRFDSGGFVDAVKRLDATWTASG